ncbi:MAG: sensor histidine kinase [Acidobacteria bacterium]|nr:MAG: sensor histidine kinase [Acidobacteriota bacterium]
MIRRFSSYLSLVYVSALLVLVAVLAVLQYRWTGEASIAEQERMRQGLQDSLSYFQRSFDREMTRIVLTYWRIPLQTYAQQPDWQPLVIHDLSEAYQRWRTGAADTRLIQRLLIGKNQDGLTPRLYSFNPGRGRLESIPWPANLNSFRRLFHLQYQGELPREESRRSGGGPRLMGNWVIDEVPALAGILAIEPIERRERPGFESRRPAGVRLCLIVCLDPDYVFREWVPALATRYLSRNADSGYDFVMTSGRNPELVLTSSPGTNAPGIVAQPDAAVRLMRLEDEELGIMREVQERRPEFRREEPDPGRQTPIRRRSPGGGPAPREERAGAGGPELSRAREQAIFQRQQLQGAAEILAHQGWQLLVKHRSGSLDAAVASTRFWNLALSLGILLLLAVSLVVLAFSVRRAQRLAKQQMEFVAGVSHELRTPIAVICSSAENLADGVITTNPQVTRYGQYILREGRRLGALVEQTLEFAGIGSGSRRFSMRPLDLSRLTRETVEAFGTQIREKNIQIDLSLSDTVLTNGDYASLSCAIGNLLSNAVKYSPPGATVRVAVESTRGGEIALITVSDNGMGIEPAELGKVFEPFFRGGNAARAQIRGAGIGLSLVKKIVEAHHGTISVNSKMGEGSVFALAFPSLSRSEEEDKQQHAASASQDSDCRG